MDTNGYKQKIILVHKDVYSPQRLAKRFPGIKWLYFGREYLDRLRWEKALGDDLRIDYKVKLNEISYSIRDEYIEWLIDLGRNYWQNWEWWVTHFATRDNLASSFYLHICYLEILKDILANRPESLIVISESWELIDTIYENYHRKIVILIPFYIQHAILRTVRYIKSKLYFVLVWGKFFAKSYYGWLAAKLTRTTKHPRDSHIFDPRHIVIHTCIDDACINQDGTFKDRYYPGLADYLRSKGFKVSTLIWLFNINRYNLFKTLRWFRNNKDSFLIPQDYYSLFDCWSSFISVIKSADFKFKRLNCFFRGCDCFSLIEQERKRQYFSSITAYFINQISMFRKWHKSGYSLYAYIDTWELKNCEVPAIIAIKKYYPLCKTIAYQHGGLVPKLGLSNYKTTEEEFNSSPHADIGIVNGKINREFLLGEGFPGHFVKLGPALRFNYLNKKPGSVVHKKDTILICLPLKINSACEMLEICHKAFSLDSFKFNIGIKFHPMLNPSIIKRNLSFCWPDNFRITEISMEECLDKARIIITNASSVMVESAYRGIGTIVLGSQTDLDIIPLDIVQKEEFWRMVYNEGELIKAVYEFYFRKDENSGKVTDGFFEFDMNLLEDIIN